MSTNAHPEAILAAFLEREGLAGGGLLLVAFSGGPDSTALLAALAAQDGPRLRAVYVDHGLRPAEERAGELALVRRTCADLSLNLTVARIRPGAIERRALATGSGIEAAARDYRRQIFATCLRRFGAAALFLAHTRDDQLETILMRALSGASSAGLGGMAERRGPWCRPFLTLPKRDLLAYLGYRGLAWSTDSTNTADAFLRNRLRHLVLPQLSAALPGWEGGLLATAQKAKAENKALEALVEERGFRPAGQDCFEADAGLLKESEAVRERAFLCAASALLGAGRLSSALAAAAFAALGGGKKRYRGGGLLLEAIGDRLRMTRELDFPRRGGYFVRVGDAASLPLRLEFRDISIRAFWTRAPGAKGAREGAFSFPLIVRSRRPGDALPIRGGRKPLDELFSEWRLPLPLRDLVPVLEDRTGILGVLGEAFGAKDRWRPCAIEASDRFLRVKVKGA